MSSLKTILWTDDWSVITTQNICQKLTAFANFNEFLENIHKIGKLTLHEPEIKLNFNIWLNPRIYLPSAGAVVPQIWDCADMFNL